MESNISAFFYRYKYYIFPQEYADLNKISDGDKIKAKRLKEERCMAPDFIYESIVEEEVEIADKNMLFPVSVNLYSGKEYDEILSKQIDKVCPGCSRFIDDDDETLDGHHREISLDGVCYERETDGDVPNYAVRSYLFLNRLAEKTDEVKKLIDAGNMKKLNKLCKSFGWIPMPYVFFGDKKDGKYRLFWRGFVIGDIYQILLKFTANAAALESSPIYGQGLEIIPYIPQDADIKLKKFDLNEPLYGIEESSVPWAFELKIYSKKKLSEKKTDQKITALHNFLCNRKGEDAVSRTVTGYDVTYDRPKELVSLSQILELIDEKDNMFPENAKKYPPPLPVFWENQDGALYGKRNFRGVTTCYELTVLGADPSQVSDINFNNCSAYAYLFVPCALDTCDKITNVVGEYVATEKDIPEPLIIKEDYLGSFLYLGGGECSQGDDANSAGMDGVVFDFLVTDENAFYRFVKILAPVLKAYNAKLVVVNDSGVNEYECGYKITPAGGAEAN